MKSSRSLKHPAILDQGFLFQAHLSNLCGPFELFAHIHWTLEAWKVEFAHGLETSDSDGPQTAHVAQEITESRT